MNANREGYEPLFSSKEGLFLLAEELKQPLTAIAQSAEINHDAVITRQARQALQTIDGILIGEQIAHGQRHLTLQPLHVGSVMTDVSRDMQSTIQDRHVRAQLQLKRGLSLIDADRTVLQHLLKSIWGVMLAMTDKASEPEIAFSAKQTRFGVRISLKSPSVDLSGLQVSHFKADSTQPLRQLAGSGADMLVALQLNSLLRSKMTLSKHSISVTLAPSTQLALV